MAADVGAVGDRGLHSSNSRPNRIAKVARKTKFISAIVVVLMVGIFAVVLVQGYTPSTALKSRLYTLDYLLWTADGDQVNSSFGASVSDAGDVNNDGYDDVIVGAPCGYIEVVKERALLYLGSSTGLSATPSWTAVFDQANARFGCSVSSAGDVNNDGYDDVVVGAYGYDSGQTDEGGAFLYLGSATGLSTTPSWTAEGDQDGANFGVSVSSAGDVNNDGYGDVIVGAPYYDNKGKTDKGCAYLYLGSSAGLSTTPSWTDEGDKDYTYFGNCVSSAGDVNNDGYDDVVVGAVFYDGDQLYEGRAYLYLGSSAGLSDSPSWVAEGNQDYARFGRSVSSAGDVNGDGYCDVIVSAPEYDTDLGDEGRVYLYYGSSTGLSTTPSWTAEGDYDIGASFMGGVVSCAGDVNGDGYSDVAVSVGYTHDHFSEGGVFLYLGSSTGPSATPSWIGESHQTYSAYGFVSSAGDVNNDGYDEVVVGAPSFDSGDNNEGRAFLYGELAAIPEFNMLLVPIVGAIAIVVVLRRLHT